MSQQLVRAAFESRLLTYAASKSLRVALQNVPFIPPVGTYLQAFVLPAATASNTLDQVHRQYRGIFQVSIVMPIGKGSAEWQGIAAELDALFPTGAPMVQSGLTVWMLAPMSAAPAITNPDRYVVPVSGRYRADTV